jgi:hypothetical protein
VTTDGGTPLNSTVGGGTPGQLDVPRRYVYAQDVMTRPPSGADEDFDARLKRLSMDSTPSKVQAYRECGLLAPPIASYPGGGGSSGRHPPEAVERMREALELDAKYPRYVAVAVMFVRGRYPVAEQKLRRALQRCVARTRTELSSAGRDGNVEKTDSSSIRTAETLARRIMREPDADPMRRRIKRKRDRRREDVLVEIMQSLVEAVTDGTRYDN